MAARTSPLASRRQRSAFFLSRSNCCVSSSMSSLATCGWWEEEPGVSWAPFKVAAAAQGRMAESEAIVHIIAQSQHEIQVAAAAYAGLYVACRTTSAYSFFS